MNNALKQRKKNADANQNQVDFEHRERMFMKRDYDTAEHHRKIAERDQ